MNQAYGESATVNGEELYLIKQSEFNYDIYVSYYKDGNWAKAIKLNSKINSPKHESSVSISNDGNYLYFSSDRNGGFGGFDIYCSEKINGDWDKPVNMGNTINTTDDEEGPFISKDNKTLFFSSKGHRNIGGMDIFFSSRLEDNTWSKPENAGFPINTTDDDLFFTPFKNCSVVYYSKYDPKGFGRNDIIRTEYAHDVRDPELVRKQKEEKQLNEISFHEEFKTDTFTIQIIALKKPVDIRYFKEIENVIMIWGTDGFYRYITGNFLTLEEAEKNINTIISDGYSDAFIRSFSSLRKISK
ncbi:MAG: hypothetical protein HC906_11715 [Bacteroidales bacterium]|nr:hypothetical protein [Bacteroidales bacterium]